MTFNAMQEFDRVANPERIFLGEQSERTYSIKGVRPRDIVLAVAKETGLEEVEDVAIRCGEWWGGLDYSTFSHRMMEDQDIIDTAARVLAAIREKDKIENAELAKFVQIARATKNVHILYDKGYPEQMYAAMLLKMIEHAVR